MMKKFILILSAVLSAAIYAPAQEAGVRSGSRVVVDGVYYYLHTVAPGETLSSLANTYSSSTQVILDSNPGVEEVKPGVMVKIPVVQSAPSARSLRRATVHTVNRGENTYSIAKRYAVSIDKLIAANPGLDPVKISPGEQIVIPAEMTGSSTQTEVDRGFEQYTESLAELYPGYKFHIVKEKETFNSIGRDYGVDAERIINVNSEKLGNGLEYGTIIKIPTGSAASDRPDITSNNSGSAAINPLSLFPGRRDNAGEAANNGRTISGNGRDIYRNAPETGYNFGRRAETLRVTGAVDVAILLPFTNNGREETNMVAFYNGALIALDQLKKEGVSARVTVFDSKRSAAEVERIFREGLMDDADLIIGPVYDDEFRVASQYAYELKVPIVSPLAAIPDISNRYVYQASPGQEYRYDKLKTLFDGNYNVIIIEPGAATDNEFNNEITNIIPPGFKRVSYSPGHSIFDPLYDALSSDTENIIVIPTGNKIALNEILTAIASLQNYVSSRSLRTYSIRTLGTSHWASFTDFDRSLFFRLGVMYVTNYHADRGNAAVAEFDSKFIEKFSYLPEGLYSYAYRGRGYDIAKLFVSALARGTSPGNTQEELLQVKYRFTRSRAPQDEKWVNNQWTLVKYNPDFTISAE